ncbi:putative peptidyl-tRNA hydrolase [Aspergillus heteromorphus CBS 117.55]|uniref:Putative peptidyl-tRNA hydrolase n=1 Tax=Aspergillus heteromorphus CBS 117.55 TaxID=1448321 RepID=A0A317VB11_9EURO|nr:putative peptidyl-tRNA hydrolase [Aspergillus heteromorphus CBS 117.55]PWY70178.1 putative peptidyl-tRNA hydrolase [Aspergillus heteromorphus CBS 117.55]
MSPTTPSSSASALSTLKTPRRFLFIASIGNPRPYRQTRHSAGHILLDAIIPLLPARAPLVSSIAANGPLFYKTWHSPAYMNESGPKLVRQFQSWLSSTQSETFKSLVQRGHVRTATDIARPEKTEWQVCGVDPLSLRHFGPTLVILHDELEAPLGKVRVRRGGPEAASLRGHRGLISAFESLRGKGLWPPKGASSDLSVLRIGVGIGRPETRNRGDVSDYVLADMNPKELAAVRAAAAPVMEALADELYRDGGGS